MAKHGIGTNEFFDINKLPAEKGLMIFPISMSRIDTGQDPKHCLDFIDIFSPSKISAPYVGLNFIYTDFLYLFSDKKAKDLKRLFIDEMLKHKNAMQKNLKKRHQQYQIQNAFNYQTWSDLYLDTKKYKQRYLDLRHVYNSDPLFQKYLKEDAERMGQNIDENQIEFFLEEHLLIYLFVKGETRLRNDYIKDHQEWVLICYPGVPMKHHIYLHHLNLFNLDNSKNKYQNCWYDLTAKKLYDFDRLDLETWNYE